MAKILLNEFTEVQRSVNSYLPPFFEGKAPPAAKEVKSDIPNEKNSFFQICDQDASQDGEEETSHITSDQHSYVHVVSMKCTLRDVHKMRNFNS